MTKFYHIKSRFFLIIVLSALFFEIAGFIIVGKEIGILATLSLILLTMISGIVLLRIKGISLIKNIQNKLIQRHILEYYIANDALTVLGAVLLILPGFISDICGILLLIKPVRTFSWNLFLSLINKTNSNTQNESEKIIELNAEDYQSYNTEKSPWYKNNDNH
ncbi:FxsA cytoplasmic membrane protein [Bartonella clarridgeiae 73]|uniref:FxsA cytoplasmic membrane protein n=1 Tax=Bartonella clarridgeiae (strain CCUG 45776 / CIP 104772 / 73) TaxID=696125 RepID=E6YG08_BARC7|nr:FxsA family protein [Bartonella clarridgeiae]WCR55595.1 MAG: FxsA protein [Bartonella clarridgeiae]CBI75796.1 FxsA cytoplasmic membrane protein [Bartonella clarridgeiae 73]